MARTFKDKNDTPHHRLRVEEDDMDDDEFIYNGQVYSIVGHRVVAVSSKDEDNQETSEIQDANTAKHRS